ncbi:MAG: precorrin-8X methylmutase [Candidatus Parabeggiatoa sp. nov. 3]|nr:MAG: precorrin-8X methylmutase [Gammaproteobacteria bacterium]RKZ88942.1 MAG: precorrin-8X methylmutase [Gammaproteobacteria bacterium]
MGRKENHLNALLPTEIEKRSFEIIDEKLLQKGYAPGEHLIVRRIVHATADFEFADSMRLHPNAVEKGVAAIRAGKPVICDARMLQAGLTRLSGRVLCAIDDEDVRQTAKENGMTRAATAMQKLSEHFDGAIIAIGNAPTALFKVMELVKTEGVKPALIVGIPVGFVGAAESKEALLESGLCYITNVGPRGGSPIVAAAVNALALL